jgi:ABC-type glutathione transport system ATPase component
VSAIFKKARREVVPAKIGLVGPSGSGKTYTALRLAGGLANGGRIALIDTEHGSASLYADEFDFDQATMAPPYDPARFAKAKDTESSSSTASRQHGRGRAASSTSPRRTRRATTRSAAGR